MRLVLVLRVIKQIDKKGVTDSLNNGLLWRFRCHTTCHIDGNAIYKAFAC